MPKVVEFGGASIFTVYAGPSGMAERARRHREDARIERIASAIEHFNQNEKTPESALRAMANTVIATNNPDLRLGL